MIIDNKNVKQSEESKDAYHKDTSVNNTVIVQHTADNVLTDLATNLEMLKNMYHNRDTFKDFVVVAEKLLKDNYDGKNSLDILYENKDFIYDEKTINVLNIVVNNLLKIENVADNLSGIEISNENIEFIKEVLPSVEDIALVAKSIKDVQRIGRNIEKIRVLHTHIIKLIVLFDSINELHTIFNYLPELLKLASFLNEVTKLVEIVVSRFDYVTTTLDNFIIEVMDMNRNITYHLDSHNNEIIKIKENIEKIEKEIVSIKEEISNIKETIKVIQNDITNIKQTIETHKETIEKLTERVEKIEKTGGTGTGYDDTEIRELINQLRTELTGKITKLEQNIKDLQNKNVIIEAGKNITIDKDESQNKYVINATASGGGTTITQELNYQKFTLGV